MTQQVQRLHTEEQLFQRLSHHRLKSLAAKSASSNSSSGLTDLSDIADGIRAEMQLDPAFQNAIANSLDMSGDFGAEEKEYGPTSSVPTSPLDLSGGHQAHNSNGSTKSLKSVKFAMFEPEVGHDSAGVSSFGSAENMVGTIREDDEDLEAVDDAVIEERYNTLLQRKKSQLGQKQRKLLTMHSVNKLTNLIDNISHAKSDSMSGQ